MRIAHLTQSYPPMISGAALVVRDLARNQANHGHDLLIITASDRAEAYTVRDGRLQVERLTSRKNPARVGQRYLLWPARAVATALHAFAPDVVHLHEPLVLGWSGLHAGQRLGVPTIFTAHQLPWFAAVYAPRLPGLPRLVELLLWRYARWFLRQCTAVVAATTTIGQIVTNQTGIKVHIIGLGIDLQRYCPQPDNAAENSQLRQKYHLHPTQPILLHVGRLDRDKSVEEVLQAATQVLTRANAQLVIVGDGSQRSALMALSHQLGIADRCHFTGYVAPDSDDLPGLYRLAAVFVTASTLETFGLVVTEAMACGCPVVAAAATCMPEIITPYRNGLLAPPHDPAGLANQLSWLLDHPADAAAIATAGRLQAQKYGLQAMETHYYDLYWAVLPPVPAPLVAPEGLS